MVTSVSRRLCMDIESLQTLNSHVQSSISNPSTWLHQKQMIDDYILYTVLNDLCSEKSVTFAYNCLEKFSEIMIKSMPLLINESQEDQKAIQKL